MSETQEVEKLAEVIKCFLRHECEEFVQARLASPIAEVLLQDVTPLRTSTVHSSGSGDLKVTGKGKMSGAHVAEALTLGPPGGETSPLQRPCRDGGESGSCALLGCSGPVAWGQDDGA